MASSSLPTTRAFVRLIDPAYEHEGMVFCGLPYEWEWCELDHFPPKQCNHHDSICDQCWHAWSQMYTVRFNTCPDDGHVVESGDTATHDSSP